MDTAVADHSCYCNCYYYSSRSLVVVVVVVGCCTDRNSLQMMREGVAVGFYHLLLS